MADPAAERAEGTADTAASAAAVGVGIENLNGAVWIQTSVEYRALALQTYGRARNMLDVGLSDSSWTAALEQQGQDVVDLPPAVILDVDETVLDNSYYQARLILDEEVHASGVWDAWVEQRAATPVPGALDFCRHADERGVTVFYVTNRRAHLEEATRANLEALGFPLGDDVDAVMTRGERPEWDTSDKGPRRDAVAATHRIVLMVGDNMGDFVSAADGSVAERRAFADAHAGEWGTRWIVLPNPMYGSWDGAVLEYRYSTPWAEQVEIKKGLLDPRR